MTGYTPPDLDCLKDPIPTVILCRSVERKSMLRNKMGTKRAFEIYGIWECERLVGREFYGIVVEEGCGATDRLFGGKPLLEFLRSRVHRIKHQGSVLVL